MNRLLTTATAVAAIFACAPTMAQSSTNAPAREIAVGPLSSAFGRTTPVNLGGAGHFVILTKTGITDVRTSAVLGNIGTSPITGAADHLACTEVTGNVYSVDAAGPAPCNTIDPSRLTGAILDMQTAYANAAGRAPGTTGLGAGNIGGLTIGPGVYKWTTDVNIPTNVTLSGDGYSIWIFQISKNLILANAKSVILHGNAQAQNIYWQVGGQVTLGTTSHMEGVILSKTLIAMRTGASINGRLFAQTAVTLQSNKVTAP